MHIKKYLLPLCPLVLAASLAVPTTAYADGEIYGWYEDAQGFRYGKDDGMDACLEWVNYKDNWYYFDEDGYMMSDEFFMSKNNLYYARDWGGIYSYEFFIIDGHYFFANDWGGIARGWFEVDGQYHFGDLTTGEIYFDTFLEWGGYLYYIDQYGSMVTGWQNIDGYDYYFMDWGGACRERNIVLDDVIYQFDEQAHLVDQCPVYADVPVSYTEAQLGVHTIENLLANAILPVGNTLYIWGGGHFEPDKNRDGVNPQWQQYFNMNDATYNPDEHEYEYGNGLDCSGYVGWVGYQVMQESLVTGATSTPYNYACRGWGSYEEQYSGTFYPGDICSKKGHAWIVIGECSDGSVVVAHSNLAYIQISGTVTRDGNADSEAIALAAEYMARYYPEAYQRYGIMMVNTTYLENTYHFSWSEEIMPDVSAMRSKSPREILQMLFHEG